MASQEFLNKAYLAYFGRPVDITGQTYWSTKTEAEVIAGFSASNESKALYGEEFNAAQVNAIYNNLFNRDAEPAGLMYWLQEVYSGRVAPLEAALAILNGAANEDKTVVENKLAASQMFTEGLDTTAEMLGYSGSAAAAAARSFLSTVTTDVPTPDQVDQAIASATGGGGLPGDVFKLTTGADNIVGTAGNDVIDGGIADSWSSFDKIDGGSGDDTMTVLVTGTSAPGGISLTNVETLNVNTTAASYTIDTTGYTGLTALNLSSSTAGPISVTGATTTAAQVLGAGNSTVDVIGTGGNLFVQTGAAAVTVGGTAVANALTSASVKGGSTVAITDRSGAGATTGTKLESVSLDGNTDAATITANGLTNLKVANTNQNATVAAAAGSRDLAVTLDTVTGGTISDNEATSLSVTASGGNSTGVTLDAAKATTVSVTANKNLTVADVNINAATGITVAGAGDFTLSAASNVGALTGIDASSATGNVTITPTLGAAVGYTGGSGKDSITVGATTKAITTGAGDDTVTVADGVTALGAGGSLDGGEGIDTLAFATYANAVTASATATFANSISGFEKLKINGANGVANATINLANLDGINDVEIAGNRTATTTISNLLSNGTVTFSVDQTNDQALTVAVKNAATGTDDVVNIGLKGTAAVGSNSITVNDVETINFVTDDTAATITNINHSSKLTADAVKTITVAGDAGLSLTYTGTTVTSFDASGVTGGAVSWTTANLAADATIVGSATRANTIDTSATSKNITYTGGSGVDTVTFGDGNNSATTAAGDDVIVVGNGSNTIDAGDGNDTITVGTGANTINAGAGNDTIKIGASTGLNVIDVGTGNDTIVLTGVQAAAGFYASVTGMGAGDVINFNTTANDGGALGAGALGAKITLGGAASFANYLDAATAGDGSTNSAFAWFQLNGNTYVVLDNAAAATFQDGVDQVVELVGLIDLSTATQNGDYVLTLA